MWPFLPSAMVYGGLMLLFMLPDQLCCKLKAESLAYLNPRGVNKILVGL